MELTVVEKGGYFGGESVDICSILCWEHDMFDKCYNCDFLLASIRPPFTDLLTQFSNGAS